jgi:hypothetical protein
MLLSCMSLVFIAGLLASAQEWQTAQQISRTGSFELACNAETAFPLFSPEGEKHWVPGWDPHPVFPATIAFARDTVFREGKGDEEALWTILRADRQAYRAEYVRVAPASHAAHIIVELEPLGSERSRVRVSYTVTAFGKHRERLLQNFSEQAYAAKLQNWQQCITGYLTDRKT